MDEYPKYLCHKTVHAVKIARIEGNKLIPTGEDGVTSPVVVTDEYLAHNQPQCPGYWVLYEDGYQSWSPVAQFEAGYTRVN